MSIMQLTSQYWNAAMPVILVSSGVIFTLLGVSMVVLRWHFLYPLIRRYLLRKPEYDYRKIFRDYLERFSALEDRRELYVAILSATCRIVGASGASLVVRDAKGCLQIKATFGLKPFSFDVGEVRGFISLLETQRAVVARGDFVNSVKYRDIKNEGLRWFVQFNAEACIPLFVGDRLYGVINLGSRRKGMYDSETKDLLKLLAVQFATSIHNANLYQAVVRQNQKLQETAQFKTQLLANISHELRTPLTAVIGLTELMAEGGDGPLNEEQHKHLSLILNSGKRLLDTVTAMVDLSRLEVDKLDLHVQKVNLGKVVQQVAEEISPNKYTKVEVMIGSETPGVYGDEARLKQVVKHLMDNAVKFTKRGKISIEAEKCGEMLKISVKDTGIGIEKKKQKAIFEGFRQGDGSATREYEGLGLGLTISKKLVELHGGRMWLTSKIGQGSEFNFTLPLRPAAVYHHQAEGPKRFVS